MAGLDDLFGLLGWLVGLAWLAGLARMAAMAQTSLYCFGGRANSWFKTNLPAMALLATSNGIAVGLEC